MGCRPVQSICCSEVFDLPPRLFLQPFQSVHCVLLASKSDQKISDQGRHRRIFLCCPDPRLSIHLVIHRDRDILHSLTVSQQLPQRHSRQFLSLFVPFLDLRCLVKPRSGEIFIFRQLPGSCRMSLRALGQAFKNAFSAVSATESLVRPERPHVARSRPRWPPLRPRTCPQ